MNDALPAHREAPDLSAQMPTEWLIEANSLSLLRRNVDINQGAKNYCGIQPRMPFFQKCGTRYFARSRLDDGVSRTWKMAGSANAPQLLSRHPEVESFFSNFQMTMVYQGQEWKDIDHWGTPTFIFLKMENSVVKVTGWPEQGNIKELKNSLQKIGLL